MAVCISGDWEIGDYNKTTELTEKIKSLNKEIEFMPWTYELSVVEIQELKKLKDNIEDYLKWYLNRPKRVQKPAGV